MISLWCYGYPLSEVNAYTTGGTIRNGTGHLFKQNKHLLRQKGWHYQQ